MVWSQGSRHSDRTQVSNQKQKAKNELSGNDMTLENTPVTYSFQQGHASHTYRQFHQLGTKISNAQVYRDSSSKSTQ